MLAMGAGNRRRSLKRELNLGVQTPAGLCALRLVLQMLGKLQTDAAAILG